MAKRVGIVLLSLAVIAAAAASGIPQFRQKTIDLLSGSACDTPITYKLGSIDPKFGLSSSKVDEDVGKAADVWSKDWGKPLFNESAGARLTINLVYDERTALTAKIDQQQNQLNQKDKTLSQQIDAHNAKLAAFEQKLASFNAQVQQINQAGGATPDQYKELVRQQSDLKAQGDALNAEARQLNLGTSNYNLNVQMLNQDVNQFNQALTLKPEEGLYDSGNKTITIYFANNQAELIHTLAHEFGHALGMTHTSDPQAIMFPSTSSTVKTAAQDKTQLKEICRKRWVWELWIKSLVPNRNV